MLIALHLHNYFNIHVWQSLRRCHTVTLPIPAVLSQNVKVAWYVMRVKNMHSWLPPDPWGAWVEKELSYFTLLGMWIMLGIAKLGVSKLTSFSNISDTSWITIEKVWYLIKGVI